MKNVILASTSIYRKEQLERLKIPFQTFDPAVDESSLKKLKLEAHGLARQLALMKAQAAQEKFPSSIIIGGDQVLHLNGELFSKPETAKRAISQLQSLQGKTHQLITSMAYLYGDQIIQTTVVAEMTMRSLSLEEISNYVKEENPLYCCGSYMLENKGIALFEKIDCPDYTSIIGIPLIATANALREFGVELFKL